MPELPPLVVTPVEHTLVVKRGVTCTLMFLWWEDPAKKIPANLNGCKFELELKRLKKKLKVNEGLTVGAGVVTAELTAAYTASIDDDVQEDHFVLWVTLPSGQVVVPTRGPVEIEDA